MESAFLRLDCERVFQSHHRQKHFLEKPRNISVNRKLSPFEESTANDKSDDDYFRKSGDRSRDKLDRVKRGVRDVDSVVFFAAAKRAYSVALASDHVENDGKPKHRNPYPDPDDDPNNATSTAGVGEELCTGEIGPPGGCQGEKEDGDH
jgi:hypothetical protein